jgi:chromosome segregation ATPase
MSIPGSSITLGIAVSVVLAIGGTAGATVLYQGSVQELHDRNDALVDRNEQLREQLNETRENLTRAREQVSELRAEISTREQDLRQFSDALEETKRELRTTESHLVALCQQRPDPGACLNRTGTSKAG